MKSIKTPHTHTAVTAEELAVRFKPTSGQISYDVVVPAGTRCVKLEGGGGSSVWVVDDLTFLGDTRSFLYHDASHTGIPIEESKLTDITPVGQAAAYAPAQSHRGDDPQPNDDSPAP